MPLLDIRIHSAVYHGSGLGSRGCSQGVAFRIVLPADQQDYPLNSLDGDHRLLATHRLWEVYAIRMQFGKRVLERDVYAAYDCRLN